MAFEPVGNRREGFASCEGREADRVGAREPTRDDCAYPQRSDCFARSARCVWASLLQDLGSQMETSGLLGANQKECTAVQAVRPRAGAQPESTNTARQPFSRKDQMRRKILRRYIHQLISQSTTRIKAISTMEV